MLTTLEFLALALQISIVSLIIAGCATLFYYVTSRIDYNLANKSKDKQPDEKKTPITNKSKNTSYTPEEVQDDIPFNPTGQPIRVETSFKGRRLGKVTK